MSGKDNSNSTLLIVLVVCILVILLAIMLALMYCYREKLTSLLSKSGKNYKRPTSSRSDADGGELMVSFTKDPTHDMKETENVYFEVKDNTGRPVSLLYCIIYLMLVLTIVIYTNSN